MVKYGFAKKRKQRQRTSPVTNSATKTHTLLDITSHSFLCACVFACCARWSEESSRLQFTSAVITLSVCAVIERARALLDFLLRQKGKKHNIPQNEPKKPAGVSALH